MFDFEFWEYCYKNFMGIIVELCEVICFNDIDYILVVSFFGGKVIGYFDYLLFW